MQSNIKQRRMSYLGSNWRTYSLPLLIGLFLLLKIIFLFKFHHPIWDEAVYLSMGKYFWSLGQSGFNEILRPIFMPLIFGLFWKLGFNYIVWTEIIEILIGVGTIFFTYKITKKEFGVDAAIIAATILAITPLFFLYTSYILVGIPAVFTVLLSIYYVYKQKYYLAGLFAGIAFLIKFPQALFAFAFLLFIVYMMISEKRFKEPFLKALKFGIVFILIISSFLIVNYFMYKEDTTEWYHAAFRPMIYSVTDIYTTEKTTEPFWFYFKELTTHNPFLLFSLAGFFFLFKDKKFKNNSLLMFTLFVFFLYYSWTGHKELRYAFSFLPFLALFAGFGMSKLYSYKNLILKWSLVIITVLVIIFLIPKIEDQFAYRPYDKPQFVSDYYEYFKYRPIEGNIITTDYVVGYYTDNRVYPAAYNIDYFRKTMKEVEYSAVYFDVEEFVCGENDVCNEQVKEMVQKLSETNLLFDEVYFGRHKYLFTTKNYYDTIPEAELYARFDLTDKVLLSKFPDDKLIVSVVLEDFPSLNDNGSDIWFRDNYEFVLDYFVNLSLPVSAAIIPSHLAGLPEEDVEKLKDSGFTFIQNGFSHSDELSKSQEYQMEKLSEGKDLINNLLGYEPKAFIPPFYSASYDTAQVLNDLGYEIYISNMGDYISSSLNRYDQKLTLISNWAKKEFISYDNLKRNIQQTEAYEPYLLFSVYYYMFSNETFSYLDLIVNLTSDFVWLDVYELNDWSNFLSQVDFRVEGDNIFIKSDYSNFLDNLTLLFYDSGEYHLYSDYNILKAKNVISDPINVCISDICQSIDPGQIVVFDFTAS